MSRTCEVSTGRFALAYIKRNSGFQLVINTDNNFTREQAEILLADRISNGENFPNERVVELFARMQWFDEHTSGDKTFPAFLVARKLTN